LLTSRRRDGAAPHDRPLLHRLDLPIAPDLPWKAGLGLWNSVPGTLAVEATLFVAAVWADRHRVPRP
jgi:hypothetical protein